MLKFSVGATRFVDRAGQANQVWIADLGITNAEFRSERGIL